MHLGRWQPDSSLLLNLSLSLPPSLGKPFRSLPLSLLALVRVRDGRITSGPESVFMQSIGLSASAEGPSSAVVLRFT